MRLVNRRGAGERSRRPVYGEVIQDTSGTEFETEHDIDDLSDQYIQLDLAVEKFELTEVIYMVNPTNAETYRLMLFDGPHASDIVAEAHMLFDSDFLQVDSQRYHETEGGIKLPVICNLKEDGRVYYNTGWTGAPGNTPGYIIIKGYALVGDA